MNSKVLRTVLAMLLTVLLTSVDVGTALANLDLTITVVDSETKRHIAGATVQVYIEGGGFAGSVITNGRGEARFPSLPDYNTYYATAVATGYLPGLSMEFRYSGTLEITVQLVPTGTGGGSATATPGPTTTGTATTTPTVAASPTVTTTPTVTASPTATPLPTATPRTNRTSGCKRCPPLEGEPIDTSTGEYIYGPVDEVDLGGPLPLQFSRYYASGLLEDGVVDSALGPNWMHSFDYRVLVEERGTWPRWPTRTAS